jgi:transposase
MDLKIREVKTKSGKVAVQVFTIVNRKRNILKHLGSTNSESEIILLKNSAKEWILNEQSEHSLFQNTFNEQEIFDSKFSILKTHNLFAYEFLDKIFKQFNFHKHTNDLVKNLVIAQTLEAGSKRHLVRYLEEQMGIKMHLTNVYEFMKNYDTNLKTNLEKETLEIAKTHFQFDFSFVLYDVTTLYFESFKNDEFKRPGFSKDHKHNQPQIVIGLVVTKDGFPVHYEVFNGNLSEGKTFLPIILDFKNKYKVTNLTVVADSAMYFKINLETLKENGINYIIGARLANLKVDILNTIDTQIQRLHKNTIRLNDLIVEYSEDRYKKDKREMDKQIERANKEIRSTTKVRNLKFLKNDKTKSFVDDFLVEKTKKLLGLKGYLTNLKLSNNELINYYHNLFKVEHAFRIAKSDLEMRPIYHHKENAIKSHILICFMSLAVSVFLELKTKTSKKEIVHQLKNVVDVYLTSAVTGKIIKSRSTVPKNLKVLDSLLH